MDILAVIIVTAIFFIIIAVYFLYITKPKKHNSGPKADFSIVPVKWSEVNAMMSQGGPANYRQAIMESDKLVDFVLRSLVKGESMGERLKYSKHLFTRDIYEKLWLAHKIRNKVAHEADFEGLSSDANMAIKHFEKALKELRVL